MDGTKLDRLQSLAVQLSQSQKVVSQALFDLEAELKTRLGGISIWGESCNVDLEMLDEDEWRYGHLFYDGAGLQIASRTTFDDMEDAFHDVPSERQVFTIQSLANSRSSWYIKLSEEKVIATLLSNIEKNIEEKLSETQQAASSLDRILKTEVSAIDKDAREVLADYSGLLGQWLKARTSVETDPADSITRSCSYLESACRLVIEDSQQSLPAVKDISNLVKTALTCLQLDSYPENESDVKQLVGGVKSIFSSVGAIRTHIGTAHGSSPGDKDADAVTAQLVNNAAAAVSIFLLRHHKKTNKALNPQAAPAVTPRSGAH